MSILVFVEGQGAGLKRTSYETITAARKIAGSEQIIGVGFNISTEQAQAAGAYGLHSVTSLSSPQGFSNAAVAAGVSAVAGSVGATTVLFSANATGKDVAPRVSIRLQAALLADAVELSGSTHAVEATRPVYAGKALAKVKATTATAVVTLRPNVFTAKPADTATTVAYSEMPLPTVANTSVVTNVTKNEGTLDVAEADIVVSGGRGLKGPEHFHLVEELAKSLGAATGASRAVVDAGWRPHREQVGQTGKTVSPNMYVACGISGAVQHLAGMSSSKIIVAINKDKDAPIFKVADYGIVGDVFEVLPKLTSKIAAITGK